MSACGIGRVDGVGRVPDRNESRGRLRRWSEVVAMRRPMRVSSRSGLSVCMCLLLSRLATSMSHRRVRSGSGGEGRV